MIEGILWVLFILACVLVSVIILLQEGKGGGLAEAFGGLGAQTFGVKAEGITKFTGYLAGAVILLAIVITKLRSDHTVLTLAPEGGEVPVPQVQTPVETEAPAGTPTPVEPGAPAGTPTPVEPAGTQDEGPNR